MVNGRNRCARRVTISAILVGGLLVAGCNDDSGVGPLGPLGPQGDVGPGEIDIESGDGILGSGDVVSEARAVPEFERIVFGGEGTVIVAPGDSGLTIEADDNLLSYLEAEVVGSALRIRTTGGVDIDPTTAPVYRITAPALTGIEVTGAAEIDTAGWDADEFTVRISGVADMTIGDLTATSLTVEVSGVATISTSGTVERQTVVLSGIVTYDGSDLESRETTVACQDDGTVTVWVTDALFADVTGVCEVSYFGTPGAVSETSEDQGSVVPLGEK